MARSTLSQFVVGKTRSGDFDEGLCSAPGRWEASDARRDRHDTSKAATKSKLKRLKSAVQELYILHYGVA